jgi:hypothetical protein
MFVLTDNDVARPGQRQNSRKISLASSDTRRSTLFVGVPNNHAALHTKGTAPYSTNWDVTFDDIFISWSISVSTTSILGSEIEVLSVATSIGEDEEQKEG